MDLRSRVVAAMKAEGVTELDLLRANARLRSETVYGWLGGRRKTTNTDVLGEMLDLLRLDIVPRSDSYLADVRSRLAEIRERLGRIEASCAEMEDATRAPERYRQPEFRLIVGRYEVVENFHSHAMAERLANAMRRHGISSARVEEIGKVKRQREDARLKKARQAQAD